MREAGFTEQRVLPAPGSGRIPGQCHLDPTNYLSKKKKKKKKTRIKEYSFVYYITTSTF
jgi:hypothetical protein